MQFIISVLPKAISPGWIAIVYSREKTGFGWKEISVLQDKSEKAVCILRETGKKEFSVNDQPYDKFSQHIGRYPCVVIAPDDASLITGASEERRKFLDSMLSQLDAEYLQHLIIYTKVLQQRNSLLKTFAETGARNFALLDVLDEQLIKPGEYIFNKRKEFLISFLPWLNTCTWKLQNNRKIFIFFMKANCCRLPLKNYCRLPVKKIVLPSELHPVFTGIM